MTTSESNLSAHARPAAEILRALAVDPTHGLTAAEAAARLSQHGPNALVEGRRRGPVRMFFDQFTDFMIVVLLIAAVVSGILGDVVDTIVILVIVVLNAVIGFIQEYRAEAAIAALRQMAAPEARVLRDDRTHSIPAQELVPGDIVLLDAGNVVPADMRLLEVAALQTQEAALTGESAAVRKSADAPVAHDAALGDRFTMAYKGTLVVHGRARGVVAATGMDTELGRIAQLLHSAEEGKTPAAETAGAFRQSAGDRGAGAVCGDFCRRRMARRTGAADAAHGHQPGGGGNPRGPASRGDRGAGNRCAPDGAAPGADPKITGSRNTRFGHVISVRTRPARSPSTACASRSCAWPAANVARRLSKCRTIRCWPNC